MVLLGQKFIMQTEIKLKIQISLKFIISIFGLTPAIPKVLCSAPITPAIFVPWPCSSFGSLKKIVLARPAVEAGESLGFLGAVGAHFCKKYVYLSRQNYDFILRTNGIEPNPNNALIK